MTDNENHETTEEATETTAATEEATESTAATKEPTESTAATKEATESTTATEETPSEESEEKEFSFVEDPDFDVNYKGDCAYEVKVVIPVANEEKQTVEVFEELSREAELPGFRKGRAPKRLVEKKFRKHVKQEVKEKLLNAAFRKLVKDKDLNPIGALDIDGLDKDDDRQGGAPLTFTLKFEVGPRVELGKYRGLDVERPVLKVEEKDVEETIANIRQRFSLYEPLKEGKAEEGDQVVIDFTGAVDGQEFPGSKAQNYPYIIGTKRFFKEFEEALRGCETGQELSCDVTLPEDYGNAALRGKQAVFSIKVHEIKRRAIPESNDEFARQAGYENLDDLRAKITGQLRQNAMAQSDRIAKTRLVGKVVETSTFEFPKTALKSMFEEAYEEELKRLRRARTPEAELREREGEIRNRVETKLKESLRPYLALNEIAEAEGLEATEEDFEKEAADLGERFGVSAEAVVDVINAEGRRGAYEARILREKALDVLLGHAVIADKDASLEDLKKELQKEEAVDES